MNKIITALLLTITMLPCYGALHNKLNKVETKIKNAKKILRTDQQQHSTLQKKLQDYETALSQLDNNLANTQKNIENKISELDQTKKNIKQLNVQYQQQKRKTTLLIQSYYHSVHHNALQETLDHRSAIKQQRMAHYQQEIQHYLHKKMQQLNHTKDLLTQTQQNLSHQMTDLTKLRDQLTREQQQLVRQHLQRANLLKTLAEKIKNERQQLTELQANKQRLAKLIHKLRKTKHDNAKYFISHRHKMSWPVTGQHTTKFGDFIPMTSLRSNGVVIKAPQMTPIKAISPGIVVFSEWMPGFGLLVILDHGGGYMSIYGHNATIKHHVGEHVAAGNIIGNVGSSGGLANPELYFSIRHNGKPLNPALWCT